MLRCHPGARTAMSRRRPQKPVRREKRAEPFHAPFGDLGRKIGPAPASSTKLGPALPASRKPALASTSRPPVPTSKRRAPAVAARALALPDEPEDERECFLRAMADVERLDAEPRVDAPPPALMLRRAPVSEEAEALAVLSDFVAGAGELDVSDSTEYVEGAVVGLDLRILRRLRRGEFAYQAILDLHGLSAVAARAALETFISSAFTAGHRCVLIVHGRGRNSPDNVPVLKERLKSWLAHGRIGRVLLAFTSARPADGGTGALYVLLRRRRGAKEPIAVYEGAKRE
jgi:DNA-nicking Smr family endonuclease